MIIETLREQRTKFQKTSERARKVREDLNDAASDIVATLGEAAALPDDLGTWSKYLIEKQAQIKEERQKQKLEIERARAELRARIEDVSLVRGSQMVDVRIAWQDLQEAIDGWKEIIGNLRQDIREAKQAIAKIVDGEDAGKKRRQELTAHSSQLSRHASA